jgi:hypothetical protein
LACAGVGSAAGDWEGDGFEKGFRLEDGVLENGFAKVDVPPERGFAPKSDSPNPGDDVAGFWDCDGLLLSTALAPADGASAVILTPLIARILPSFLRHVFLLQEKMYNRRSCVGKRSGSSAFS